MNNWSAILLGHPEDTIESASFRRKLLAVLPYCVPGLTRKFTGSCSQPNHVHGRWYLQEKSGWQRLEVDGKAGDRDGINEVGGRVEDRGSINDTEWNVVPDVILKSCWGVVALQKDHTKMEMLTKECRPWRERL